MNPHPSQDDHMRLVGMVSHNAALAELAMFEAFVLLSGCRKTLSSTAGFPFAVTTV